MENSKNLDICMLDLNKQPINEISVQKPISYEALKKIVIDNFKLNSFVIYYYNKNNIEVELKNNFEYNNIDDLIFVMEKKSRKQSLNDEIYESLSNSKIELIDEKYLCNLCEEKLIENPYFCYRCQKRFCKKCLDDLNKNQPMMCPFCKYQLPIEKWETIKNFEEEKKQYLESVKKIQNLEKEKIAYEKREKELIKHIKLLEYDLSNQINNGIIKNNVNIIDKRKIIEEKPKKEF